MVIAGDFFHYPVGIFWLRSSSELCVREVRGSSTVFSVSWPARHRRPQNSKFKKIATISNDHGRNSIAYNRPDEEYNTL